MFVHWLTSLSPYEISIEVVGLLGIIAAITAFQCKRHMPLMTFRSANELLFAVQYLMPGAYTGMAMNLIGVLRNTIFTYQVKQEKSTFVARIIFSVLFILFACLTWAGIKSIMTGIIRIDVLPHFKKERN